MRQRGPHLVQSAAQAPSPRGEGDSRGAELADVISRLRRAMRRAARAADPVGKLSVAQLELLSCLAENPGARPGQLARMLRIAPSSEATLASGLRRAGLITRSPDPDDRRVRVLAITSAGHQIRMAVQDEIQANEERVLGSLRPGDRDAFLRAAQTLSALPPGEITGR